MDNITSKDKAKVQSKILDLAIILIISILFTILIRTFIFTPFSVSGESMHPTFKDNDKIVINKLYFQPQRGDVIVLKIDNTKKYIKRVIAIEGDTLKYKNDILYINGKKIKEPYLKEIKQLNQNMHVTNDINQLSDLPNTNGENIVPKDKIIVMGDNRLNSLDSRYGLGFIDEDQIEGKVDIRYYPFEEFKIDFDTH